MKALSLHQPWASLIADGRKTIEVRSWETKHRGEVLICAAKVRSCEVLHLSAHFRYDPFTLPYGVALCVADLWDITPFRPKHETLAQCHCDEGLRHFAWHLDNVRRVEPFPVVGRQRLFNVPDELIRVVAPIPAAEGA